MMHLGTGPYVRANDAARASDRTALICICALGLTLSGPAAAEAQTTDAGRQATVTRAATVNDTVAPPTSLEGISQEPIRPFRAYVSDAAIADLRRRIAATRWPTMELVKDRSQGGQLATLKELARYWSTEYDWRKAEAKLNALPQFVTKIDGVDIHFIHVKSRHPDALPLIMTHGWPGSVFELLETVGPLTDPTAYGGTAGDAFHLVLPSLPGYGFSSFPARS